MWKIFKIELYYKLANYKLSKRKLAPILINTLDSCYKRHIDVQSGGGRVAPSLRTKPLTEALNGLCNANWSSSTPSSIRFYQQLSVFIYAYWQMRVIQGPIGNTIVLFPGVFVPPTVPVNLSGNSLDFIDALTDALILHKSTMSGITINHFPVAVTPWSGTSLLSFDEVANAGGMVSKMTNFLSSNLDDKIAAGYLNPEDKGTVLNSYSRNMNSVLNPLVGWTNDLPVVGKSTLL